MSELAGWLRAAAFYVGYAAATIAWGTLGVLTAWALPYRARFVYVVWVWSRMVLAWLWITCGIRAEVEGREHLPADPAVVLSRHESTWETLYLQSLFVPQATVIKRELLRIPFFGWAYALLRPIAIDRNDPRGALRELVARGKRRLLEDRAWVILFPEGTRMPHERDARFQRGGAALAVAAGRPVVVVAHDAGRYWPARRFAKRPGIIRVRISPPMYARDGGSGELNLRAERWLREAMNELRASGAPLATSHVEIRH